MQLTRNTSVWNALVRYGRSAVGVTLLLAGMSTVTQAHNHNYGSWYVPPTHTGSGGTGYHQPTPTPSTPPSTVPEIDMSAAVGGLALLFGMLLLLRDRALAR